MSSDGKSLEAFVKFVEEQLLQQGFKVTSRERVTDENGVPIAEFDIVVRGRVGSTDFSWLIECRDRPSDGPQNRSWINELVGRRDDFMFNNVTAVSTTGFSSGAIDRAKEVGIELREVRELDPDAFQAWLLVRVMVMVRPHVHVTKATYLISEDEPEEMKRAVTALQAQAAAEAAQQPVLRSIKNGEVLHHHQAVGRAVQKNKQWLDGVVPGGPPKLLKHRLVYSNDEDHFVIDTAAGPVRVQQIAFEAELSIVETVLPLLTSKEYVSVAAGRTISSVAAFEPYKVDDKTSFSLEVHRLAETGQTVIVGKVTSGEKKVAKVSAPQHARQLSGRARRPAPPPV